VLLGTGGSLILEKEILNTKGTGNFFSGFKGFLKKTPSAHISTLKNYTGNFYIILCYFDAKI
jgi:hypothetical protein